MIKQYLKNIIEENNNIASKIYNIFIQSLIVLSVVSFSIETISDINDSLKIFLNYFEIFTVTVFTLEYVSRIYIAEKKLSYIFSFYGIVDLLSFLPFYLTSYIDLRIIRVFRLLRLLKFTRYATSIDKFYQIILESKKEFIVFFILAMVMFYLASVGIYYFEHEAQPKAFGNVFDAMWWAVATLTTVGYGDVYPVTAGGKIFTTIILLIGLGIVGVPAGIIASALSKLTSSSNSGYFPYKNKNHIVIINYNQKLETILEELNLYYKGLKTEQDIVLFLPNTDIEKFNNNLSNYPNINIFSIAGDIFYISSYERLNIKQAKKIIVLKNKEVNNKKLLKFITNEIEFENKDIKFIVEINNDKYNNSIYTEIFHKYSNFILVNSDNVIKIVIKRSIINYAYFEIIEEIISFEGYEFYVKEVSEFFNKSLIFKDIFNSFEKGLVIGVVRDDKPIINPPQETIINTDDKLILLLKEPDNYKINLTHYTKIHNIKLKHPKLKEFKKIAIVGNYSDIKKDDLNDFLTDEGIEQLQIFTKDDYYNYNFWKELDKNYDLIVLNLEDEFEFNLTLYLKSVFKERSLLQKIVNIVNNPLESKLLSHESKNIILSQDLVAKYIVQNVFSPYIAQIFYELTHSFGSELYILSKNDYKEIFQYSFLEFKNILLENKMIYIGAFIEDKFVFEYDDFAKINKFVVIAEGV